MNLLLCGDTDAAEMAVWRLSLAAALPEASWFDAAAAHAEPASIEAAVVANPAPGQLQGLPRLKLIQSLWAGVDRLMADATLPRDVPLARMVDPSMNAAMAETALWAVLSLHRGFFAYAHRQRRSEWRVHAQRRAEEVPVLVLGSGQMGQAAAARIAALGYPVKNWRRDGVALPDLLPLAAIVINLLPLTPQTSGILNAAMFAALPQGASLVNLGRGAHLVDADLLAVLETGHLRHAVLDVFATEPLPADHPFWAHPNVTVLPHAAALTDPRSAAAVAAANVRAALSGAPIAHLVDSARGY